MFFFLFFLYAILVFWEGLKERKNIRRKIIILLCFSEVLNDISFGS